MINEKEVQKKMLQKKCNAALATADKCIDGFLFSCCIVWGKAKNYKSWE
jgi:hypothetical protein